jgi:hypothetical protein
MGCAFLSVSVLAQPQFQAGGNFSLAYPQREFKDNIKNMGIGGGLMIRVYDALARGREGSLQAAFVDLGVRYVKGGEAEYLREGDIQKNPRRPAASRSETDMVTFHVGVSFDFTIGHSLSTD